MGGLRDSRRVTFQWSRYGSVAPTRMATSSSNNPLNAPLASFKATVGSRVERLKFRFHSDAKSNSAKLEALKLFQLELKNLLSNIGPVRIGNEKRTDIQGVLFKSRTFELRWTSSDGSRDLKPEQLSAHLGLILARLSKYTRVVESARRPAQGQHTTSARTVIT